MKINKYIVTISLTSLSVLSVFVFYLSFKIVNAPTPKGSFAKSLDSGAEMTKAEANPQLDQMGKLNNLLPLQTQLFTIQKFDPIESQYQVVLTTSTSKNDLHIWLDTNGYESIEKDKFITE